MLRALVETLALKNPHLLLFVFKTNLLSRTVYALAQNQQANEMP